MLNNEQVQVLKAELATIEDSYISGIDPVKRSRAREILFILGGGEPEQAKQAMHEVDFSKPCYSVSTDVSTMAPGKYGYREARTKYHGCVWADDHAQALAQAIEQFGPGEYIIETAAEQQERRKARAARANFTLDDLLAQDWTPALMPEGAREFPVFIEGVHKFDVRAVSLEAAREHVAQFYTAVHEVRPIAELKVEAKAAA